MRNKFYTYLIALSVLCVLNSCNHSIQKVKSENIAVNECEKTMKIIERDLFISCPFSQNPLAAVLFLDSLANFKRNKEYDYGNGSVRYNSKNAKFYNCELVDEKSVFLINYSIDPKEKPKTYLFQAIYFFKREEDKNLVYDKMITVLNKELKLKPEIRSDIENNPYFRYYLPCGAGINFKYSVNRNDMHVINILWVVDAKN